MRKLWHGKKVNVWMVALSLKLRLDLWEQSIPMDNLCCCEWMTLHWIMKSFYPHVLLVTSLFYGLINTHGARCWEIPGSFPRGYNSHSVSVDYSQHQRLCHICDHCWGFYAFVWNDECIEAHGLSKRVAPDGPHTSSYRLYELLKEYRTGWWRTLYVRPDNSLRLLSLKGQMLLFSH